MGGSKPKAAAAAPVIQNAPGSVAAATIDNATADARDNMREKLQNARGRNFTNKTGGVTEQLKKALLGE